MGERTQNLFKRLFEVRIFHHYWLDEGPTLFDAMLTPEQQKRLLNYDCRKFLIVTPTSGSEKQLNGLQCIFKMTPIGFIVAAPSQVKIPDETEFEFVLTILDQQFFNYTSLTLIKRKTKEIYYPPENKMYRYKEYVPLLSNLTGVSRGAGANQVLYLSKEFPLINPANEIESLIQSGNALHQLTSDQPGALDQQLDYQFANSPVFVHQDDSPLITPPVGLIGAPSRGIELTEEIPEEVFALIRIAAVKPGDAAYTCTINQLPKANPPVFHIRFKNRSTFWRYFDKRTQTVTSTEPSALPLTFQGNAGTKQKPFNGHVKKMKLNNAPGAKEHLVSEIYI